MESLAPQLALVKYWLTSELLRTSFFRSFSASNTTHLTETHGQLGLAYYWVSDPGILSSLWIGSVYVVIEGYRALDIADPELDKLLESDFVDSVRLYRNAVFHFQNDSFHEKYLPMLESFEAKQWLDDVHKKTGNILAQRVLGISFPNGDIKITDMQVALAQKLTENDS